MSKRVKHLKKQLRTMQIRHLRLRDECSNIADNIEILHSILLDRDHIRPISSDPDDFEASIVSFVTYGLEDVFKRINKASDRHLSEADKK